MIAAIVITSSFPATTANISMAGPAADPAPALSTPTVLIAAQPAQETVRLGPDRADRATRTAVTTAAAAAQTAVTTATTQTTATAGTTVKAKKRPVKTAPVKQRPPVKAKKTTVQAPAVNAPAGGRVDVVVGFALAQVGKPYQWGAAGPGAYDCSGLTMAAFARAGIRLPHQSGGQASAGRAVTRAQLQRGDLILYSGHVAIALGGGKMVHAANPRTGIVVANIYGNPIGYRRLL